MNPHVLIASEFWAGYWTRYGERLIAAGARVVAIVLAYIILRLAILKLLNRVTDKLLRKVGQELTKAREARLNALQSALKSAALFVLGFVAAIMILHAVGLNVVPLITTASVAGLAVGFGAQKLVRDVIAGLFILIEDQYGVGDLITISGITGTVEELGMRITRVRDESGRLWTLANGDIAQVCNHSRK